KFKKRVSALYTTFLINISPVLATKYLYKKRTGRRLNLKSPRNFNEKVNWLKLYWRHPLVAKCGDKYEMREYVKENNCPEILTNIYNVYYDISDIDWNSLPQKFVIKVTNGCGFNIICRDKRKLDINETKNQINKWMNTNYSLKAAEIHYKKMTPRIICEKFLETKDN